MDFPNIASQSGLLEDLIEDFSGENEVVVGLKADLAVPLSGREVDEFAETMILNGESREGTKRGDVREDYG